MTVGRNTLVLLLVTFGIAWLSDAGESSAPAQDSRYKPLVLMLPDGDRDDGRQALLDLKCTVCHRVIGESDFPEPISATPGPPLGRALAGRSTGVIATAIVAPSHSISVNINDEVKTQLEGVLSPMADYRHVMSIKQLLDLLAYLSTTGE